MIGRICKFVDPTPQNEYMQIPLWYPQIPQGSLVLVVSKECHSYLVLSDFGIHEVTGEYLSVCNSNCLKAI